jgi:hypothetical protein
LAAPAAAGQRIDLQPSAFGNPPCITRSKQKARASGSTDDKRPISRTTVLTLLNPWTRPASSTIWRIPSASDISCIQTLHPAPPLRGKTSRQAFHDTPFNEQLLTVAPWAPAFPYH